LLLVLLYKDKMYGSGNMAGGGGGGGVRVHIVAGGINYILRTPHAHF
jgi:hypothetical protein